MDFRNEKSRRLKQGAIRAMFDRACTDISAFGLTSQAFCELLLERKGVVCIPGSAFGACGEGHIRVAYTCEEGMLQEAVNRLQQFCREVK